MSSFMSRVRFLIGSSVLILASLVSSSSFADHDTIFETQCRTACKTYEGSFYCAEGYYSSILVHVTAIPKVVDSTTPEQREIYPNIACLRCDCSLSLYICGVGHSVIPSGLGMEWCSDHVPDPTPNPLPPPPPPPLPPPSANNPPPPDSASQCGSIIYSESQILGETIPLSGIPFDLYYFTDKTKGYRPTYTLKIPVTHPTVHPDIAQILIHVTVAGKSYEYRYPPLPGLIHTFTWDGLDQNNNPVWGTQVASITLKEISSSGSVLNTLTYPLKVGGFEARLVGLGGWLPGLFHYYDIQTRRIMFGDGSYKLIPDSQPQGGAVKPTDLVVLERGESYSFDSYGRIQKIKAYRTGQTLWSFHYSDSGELLYIEDTFSNKTAFERNSSGQFVRITGPYGKVTHVSQNANGYLTEVRNPASEVYKVTYLNADGLLSQFQKPMGQLSQFNYDSLGRLTRDTHSSGFLWDIIGADSEDGGREIRMTTAEGRQTLYTSRVTSDEHFREETSAYGGQSIFKKSYKPVHHYSEQTEESGNKNITTFALDNRFWTLEMNGSSTITPQSTTRHIATQDVAVNPSLNGNPYEYESLIRYEGINGKVTAYTYTPATQLETMVTPEERRRTVKLDSLERPIEIKSGSIEPVKLGYDPRGRLSYLLQGERLTQFEYNSQGELQNLVNPLGQKTSFAYDSAGRVIQKTFADSRKIAFAYDKNGNLIALKTPSHQVHQFALNAFEGLMRYLPPSLGGGVWHTEYSYNKDRQITQILRPDGQAANFHYGLTTGLLNQITTSQGDYAFSYKTSTQLVEGSLSPDGVHSHQQYDGDLVLSETQSGSGLGSVTWDYNNDFSITSIRATGTGSSALDLVPYEYDRDLLLTRAGAEALNYDSKTGVLKGTVLDRVSDRYSYNGFSEVSQYRAKISGQRVYQASYARDSLGRITHVERTEIPLKKIHHKKNKRQLKFENLHYVYDKAGRLVEVYEGHQTLRSYTYDSNGNRIKIREKGHAISATFDSQDRIVSQGSLRFTHNSNGDRTSQLDTSKKKHQMTRYSYDTFGNLKKVTLSNTQVIEYVLDSKHRRVAKKINGSVKKRYLYQTDLQIAAELDAHGNLTKRFVYASKAHVPDFMITDQGTYRILSDERGSPILVVHTQTGQIYQQMAYDEFGQVIYDSHPGFQPFGFAGGLYDLDTKLVRFGARDYDPETGRWLSKDPIGFAGGDTNLYGYVLQDPVNFIDPTGNNAFCIGACIGNYFSNLYEKYNVENALNRINNNISNEMSRNIPNQQYLNQLRNMQQNFQQQINDLNRQLEQDKNFGNMIDKCGGSSSNGPPASF